jgi:hypothetical protein
MSNSINLPKQIKLTNITYDGPMANNYGGKFAKVTYDGKWPLVQTPKMSCPFGLGIYQNEDNKGNKTGDPSYSFNVDFTGYDLDQNTGEVKNPKVKDMYDLVQNLDDHLVEHVSKNSFTWVDDPDAEKSVCKALRRDTLKWSKDKDTKKPSTKYPPNMKFSLPVYDGDMKFKAFLDGANGEIKSMEELQKVMVGRCQVTVIGRCDRITFNGGKYGFKWTVQQLKIYTVNSSFNNYAFIADSDDEDDTGAGTGLTSIVDKESSDNLDNLNKSPDLVEDTSDEESDEDSDSEEEEEEEEQKQEPEPEPKKKKKVVKKTK